MEDCVTYEQAVRLKECGFNWECSQYYWNKNLFCIDTQAQVNRNVNGWGRDGKFSAPTLSQAAKWLREVKGLFLDVWLCTDGYRGTDGYSWCIEKCGNPNCNSTFVTEHDEESGDDIDSGLFTTYEKSLSSAIDVALKLI